MIERRKFAELGGADHGWLKAKPTLPMRCISTWTILTQCVGDRRASRRAAREQLAGFRRAVAGPGFRTDCATQPGWIFPLARMG